MPASSRYTRAHRTPRRRYTIHPAQTYRPTPQTNVLWAVHHQVPRVPDCQRPNACHVPKTENRLVITHAFC